MIDLKNLTLEELEQFLSGKGKERFRASQIFKWMYQKNVTGFDEMTNISKELKKELSDTAFISELLPAAVETGSDGTRKYLFTLKDGESVESVVIPDEERNTLCISSQVGCAMGCRFCLTGTFSLARNLETSEIVNQVCAVKKDCDVKNIVFMGMGEPLHNLDNVIRAIKILREDNGLQFSSRRVTVSTSGLVPEMIRLGEAVTVNLAVSLNASNNEQRNLLMPVNRTYPIEALMDACKRFPMPGRRKITFEYVLIKGVNDSVDDAKRMLKLIANIPSKVNLIPFNEHEGSDFKSPDQSAIDAFHSYLISRNVTVITRDSRGSDISAACGQLKGRLKKKDSEPESDKIVKCAVSS